jgi:hypothetical protein
MNHGYYMGVKMDGGRGKIILYNIMRTLADMENSSIGIHAPSEEVGTI